MLSDEHYFIGSFWEVWSRSALERKSYQRLFIKCTSMEHAAVKLAIKCLLCSIKKQKSPFKSYKKVVKRVDLITVYYSLFFENVFQLVLII